jgi:pimeloyl-ACP methyl ester carboxylesterase
MARIAAGTVTLDADVTVPPDAWGVVAFAHGSGSSRHSPRNREVAASLARSGFATVLADLLTPDEERADRRTGHLRFDIDLLAARTVAVVDWVAAQPALSPLPVGLFGASTGAAAALLAAVERPDRVMAVVSRGGRPDLVSPPVLGRVQCPTLLIVGGRDTEVLRLNRQAAAALGATAELVVVEGASHLFEEPGALKEVARLADDWFTRKCANRPAC